MKNPRLHEDFVMEYVNLSAHDGLGLKWNFTKLGSNLKI